jgi:hypothetical protein
LKGDVWMIVLILYEETNKWTKQKETLVSHGVDTHTLANISLPSVSPNQIGYYSQSMGEWILKEN